MKAILESLGKMEDLLRECSMSERADWIQGKRRELMILDPSSGQFRSLLTAIRDIIAGAGSFTDIPLVPKPGSSLTKDLARKQQWEIAERLDSAISDCLSSP